MQREPSAENASEDPAQAASSEVAGESRRHPKSGKLAAKERKVGKVRPLWDELPEGKGLDFIVIGAQRSGTTTLWMHLNSHPEVYMPSDKEAPLFSHDGRYERGLSRYLRKYFSLADPQQHWGTATPQYMRGTAHATPAEIAHRMHGAVPEARLIAVLRDPVERAVSQFRYAVRRGQETRTFRETVSDLLAPAALEQARVDPGKTNTYFVLGEYGRILRPYVELFGPEALHVCFTKDLDENPHDVVEGVYRHIRVDSSYVPDDLAAHHHRGGSKARIPDEAVQEIHDYLTANVWSSIPKGLGDEVRRGFDYWFRQWNVIPETDESELEPTLEEELRAHYRSDEQLLEELLGVDLPWRLQAPPEDTGGRVAVVKSEG